jgi:uncharacterized membrane protein
MALNTALTKPAHNTSTRLWEVDALRGMAVLAMIFFHFVWDLQFFELTGINAFSVPWQLFARAIGATFMFVMGVSLMLDASKYEGNLKQIWRRNLKRGSIVFGAGMLVTVVTLLAVGDEFVRFGILHLAGVSIICAMPFLRRSARLSLLTGIALIAAGLLANGIFVSFPWLIPLGVRQDGVRMVDYYTLLPWFGVVLLGIAFGKYAYSNKHRRIEVPEWRNRKPVRLLQYLGKHSLAIYLIHQPLLIAAIYSVVQIKTALESHVY